MEKFVTCHVCIEVYDGHLRCPRMLQCGHSFCSLCIEKLLAARSECPICLMPIANGILELISINYSLKQMAENCSGKENDDTSNKEGSGSESQCQRALLPYEGSCELHKITQRFRCMTCSIWICGECVAISHKYCKTLLVNEAFKEMKEEHNNEILKHLEITPKSEEDISLFLVNYNEILEKYFKELECYQKKIEGIKQEICEVNQKKEKMINMQTDLKSLKEKLENQMKATNNVSLAKDLDVLKEQLTYHFKSLKELVINLEVLKSGTVCKTMETQKPTILHLGEQYAYVNLAVNKRIVEATTSSRGISIIMTINGTTRYGHAFSKNQIIWVCCDENNPTQTRPLVLTMDQYLMTLFGTKEWPQKIFFQFDYGSGCGSEVTISLNNETKEASKLVKMYLFGEKGETFKGMEVVLNGGIVKSAQYIPTRTPSPDGANLICFGNILPVPSNVDSSKLLKEVTKRKEWKDGEMALQLQNGVNGLEFWLWIFAANSNEELELIPAGEVESGLQECHKVFHYNNNRIMISSCGINLGKI